MSWPATEVARGVDTGEALDRLGRDLRGLHATVEDLAQTQQMWLTATAREFQFRWWRAAALFILGAVTGGGLLFLLLLRLVVR